MLDLKDFYHLPQVDDLVQQLEQDQPGLVVVAGLDPRPPAAPSASRPAFLPSGRATIFGILARRVLARHVVHAAGRQAAGPQVVLVAESRDALRVEDGLRGHVQWLPTREPDSYAGQMAAAVSAAPDVLVIDQLSAETVSLAGEAVGRGTTVLAQLDCVFAGAGVARHLHELGLRPDLLAALTWIVTVQRLPVLCQACRQPVSLDAQRLADYRSRYPDLPLDGVWYRVGEAPCRACGDSRWAGDIAVFDFFRASGPPPTLFEQPSRLSMEEYVLRLALDGRVTVDDVLQLDANRLHRTYTLLTASETALAAANSELRSKVTQLESANRVLTQRTESLVSLEGIARTLIGSTELADLGRRIGAHVHNLLGADRLVLYVLRPDLTVEVLAAPGWDPSFVGRHLDALEVFGAAPVSGAVAEGPAPYKGWPPGVPQRHPDVEGAILRAGLRVPLLAQNEVVGLLIVHATRKARFSAGEVALLQAYADQVALAIQRAGLIESLRDKIVQLQAAQAELVRKERLEHELELARQVQQSLLPRVFPDVAPFAFAAHNEPARWVGGDLYDVFDLGAGRVGLAIADVSDKGMPAALFMTLTRSLLLAEARRELSPRRVLERVQALLLELGDPEMFVTVFYGVLDSAARTLTYTRAGHERPLLLRDGSSQALGGRGTFLGYLAPDWLNLTEEQVTLQPGDCLVLYTDGLVDALSPDDERYGEARLAAFLSGHADLPPRELCAAVFAELADYQGTAEQFDDMALLIVSVK